MTQYRSALIDVILMAGLLVLSAVTIWSILNVNVSRWVTLAGITGIVAVGLALVIARFATLPDHVRALQSHKTLMIANAAIGYMREGLSDVSAQAVCRIVLADTHAAAVSLTDTERVLGFAGIGEDHHSVGEPILTRATRESIETGEHRILATKPEIGCPRSDCRLTAAIVVPLVVRGCPVGTLKFYFTTPRLLNETQVAMAEGLAMMLSTQLELSELEAQTELATRMELKALQAQINPHFLFNTINTIGSLVRTDPERARGLLREFAAFYRRTLESGDELITLEQELEQTRRYLTFELARFGDRVVVEEEIESHVLRTLVPAFVVQPLVENAIEHGMRAEGPLTVRLISTTEDHGTIRITVTDDGVGIPADVIPHLLEVGSAHSRGIALKNVDDRLRGHYGPGSGVFIESTEGKGTAVSLVIARGAPDFVMEA